MTELNDMLVSLFDIAPAVDAIIELGEGGQEEEAHSIGDQLMRALLIAFAPPETLNQLHRLWDADFARWYE